MTPGAGGWRMSRPSGCRRTAMSGSASPTSRAPITQAARARRLRRTVLGYTTDSSELLLGLGPAAIGALPQGYVQNAAATADWTAAIAHGQLATAKGIAIDDDDRLRRAVIERLM